MKYPAAPKSSWSTLRTFVDRLFGRLMDESATVDECLDALLEALTADRAVLLLSTSDGASHIVRARQGGRTVTDAEREEISRGIVAEVRSSQTTVVWDALAKGPAGSSLAFLGISVAMAAPLRPPDAQAGASGVLYVDYRNPTMAPESDTLELFATVAVLFGTVLEERWRLHLAQDRLREARMHCTESHRGPSLDDLLCPESMRLIRDELSACLNTTTPLLVLGETGTGKTMLSQAIAEASARRPIVRAMLGGSDDLNTITSELFGHEKGAYSGATGNRVGLVEFAAGGTLVLDEVLNMPPHAQRLLLDFTQFGTYRPLGYQKPQPKHADVRIVAATNGDLRAAVASGRFREDLYYRLAVVTLEIPPLRKRRAEIAGLAEAILRQIDSGRSWSLSVPCRRALGQPGYEWPGNVRELESLMRRARDRALRDRADAKVIEPVHLDAQHRGAVATVGGEPTDGASPRSVLSAHDAWAKIQKERERLDLEEARLLTTALEERHHVLAHLARDLGLPRTTIASRLDALGVARKKER